MIERIKRLLSRSQRDRDRYEPQRRTSRREREQQQRRILYIAMASITTVVVVLLVGGVISEFVIQPRQTVATVNGTKITRNDYWKYRRYSLIQQIQQYQFLAGQNPQYQSFVQQLQTQLLNVKSGPLDATTISNMVDDQVTVQRMSALGVTITDADLTAHINETFAPVPLTSPTPTATVNPTAAAWTSLTATAAAITPTVPPTPGTPGAATPGTPGTPGTPVGTPATPGTPGTPGTPAPTPTIPGSATPNREEALATSTVGYGTFVKNLKDATGMSSEDYIRLVARPELARQRVTDVLTGGIKDVQPQVHAFHILVATEDGAKQVQTEVTTGGKNFQDVARAQSTDTSTAPTGGDLGWFPRGVMVKEFEDVAFSLQPGQISAPVKSKFGWHVIMVTERADDRPLTEETLSSLKSGAFTKWLDGEKATSSISTDQPPVPTPVSAPFEAPPGAPPTPVPTPVPTPTIPAAPGTPGAAGTRTPGP